MLNALLMPTFAIVLIVLGAVLACAVVFCLVFPVFTWLKTVTAQCRISLAKLFAMKIRKSDYKKISEAYINCQKSKINLTVDELEAHHVAGGDVIKFSDGLIMAKSARLALTIDVAKAIDLAGKNLVEVVKDCISPRIIETEMVKGVAKDGFEIFSKAKITVLAQIDKLLGGADERTVALKVGEALISEVGSCIDYTDAVYNPDRLTKNITDKNLDKTTAYKILSINICEMNLGKNIEEESMVANAEAERKVAEAKAAERKANAQVLEQEAKIKVQEAKAGLIEAEKQVPLAIADAFDKGKIAVEDYLKIQNIMADTEMRKKFGEDDKGRI